MAYTSLTALAHGAEITAIGSASICIGGLEESELEDEARITEIFVRFGTVLAVTLHSGCEESQGSWALLTFAQEAEAQSSLRGVESLETLGVREISPQAQQGPSVMRDVMGSTASACRQASLQRALHRSSTWCCAPAQRR
jgi:hypothetical protein